MHSQRIAEIWVVLFLSNVCSSSVITVNQGKLSGKEENSDLNGKTFYSFLGIPYAKPPVGNLRFQVAQPAEKWSGVLDATKEMNPCMQKDLTFTQIIVGNEDCLYLNVHIPELPSLDEPTHLKAVMVFIHGGAFTIGSSSSKLFSPDYLILRDVIYVSMNYRLNIMGFLSLDIAECPGNVGLKDIILALRWIKENIKSFGGDPDNVTIFGESAGANAAYFLVVSPLAEGLFHKAILQSKSNLNRWDFTTTAEQTGLEFGKSIGFNGTDRNELFAFLQGIPGYKLTESAFKYQYEFKMQCGIKFFTSFIPSLESDREGALLPAHPLQLAKTAKPLPVIFGINNLEGSVFYVLDKPEYRFKWLSSTSLFLECNYDIDKNVVRNVTNEILNFYFGTEKIFTMNTLQNLTNLLTDYAFAKDFYNTFKFAPDNENHPMYQYLFSYNSERNIYKKFTRTVANLPGAGHGDELTYLFFGKILPKLEYTEDQLYIIHSITTLWTNFAKTGNPNGPDIDINWKPSTNQNPVYLEIKKNLTVKQGKIFEERMSFWQNFENRYLPIKE